MFRKVFFVSEAQDTWKYLSLPTSGIWVRFRGEKGVGTWKMWFRLPELWLMRIHRLEVIHMKEQNSSVLRKLTNFSAIHISSSFISFCINSPECKNLMHLHFCRWNTQKSLKSPVIVPSSCPGSQGTTDRCTSRLPHWLILAEVEYDHRHLQCCLSSESRVSITLLQWGSSFTSWSEPGLLHTQTGSSQCLDPLCETETHF